MRSSHKNALSNIHLFRNRKQNSWISALINSNFVFSNVNAHRSWNRKKEKKICSVEQRDGIQLLRTLSQSVWFSTLRIKLIEQSMWCANSYVTICGVEVDEFRWRKIKKLFLLLFRLFLCFCLSMLHLLTILTCKIHSVSVCWQNIPIFIDWFLNKNVTKQKHVEDEKLKFVERNESLVLWSCDRQPNGGNERDSVHYVGLEFIIFVSFAFMIIHLPFVPD